MKWALIPDIITQFEIVSAYNLVFLRYWEQRCNVSWEKENGQYILKIKVELAVEGRKTCVQRAKDFGFLFQITVINAQSVHVTTEAVE